MEIRPFESFKPAPYNPRIMSDHDGESLDESIKRFGDISGITKNVFTGNLVTGHQRMSRLQRTFGADRIKFNVQVQASDSFGTVGTGFVSVDGTDIRLNYREVNWTEADEKVANIAANRIEGDWDKQLLSELNYEISQMQNAADLLALTGQTADDVAKSLKLAGVGDEEPDDDGSQDDPEENEQSFKMTLEQSEVVSTALNLAKRLNQIPSQEQKTMNGIALYYMASEYLTTHKADIEAEADFTPPEIPEA